MWSPIRLSRHNIFHSNSYKSANPIITKRQPKSSHPNSKLAPKDGRTKKAEAASKSKAVHASHALAANNKGFPENKRAHPSKGNTFNNRQLSSLQSPRSLEIPAG